jgi:hypothetical protein
MFLFLSVGPQNERGYQDVLLPFGFSPKRKQFQGMAVPSSLWNYIYTSTLRRSYFLANVNLRPQSLIGLLKYPVGITMFLSVGPPK